MAVNPDGFPYVVPLRWSDFDRYGHIHNAVYAALLETAREAFFVDVLGEVPGFVLVRLELDYVLEVCEGAPEVFVCLDVEHVGKSSYRLLERMAIGDGTEVARARVTCVMWEPELHRTRLITPDERVRLAARLLPDSA